MLKNKLKKIIFISLLSLTLTPKVYASCTEEEIEEFKKVEKEFYINYEMNQETKKYDLYLYYSEIANYDISIAADNDYNEYIKVKDGLTKVTNVDSGIVEAYVIGYGTCDNILKDLTLNLPDYNKYADDELCVGNEEFYLCKVDYDSSKIDYETFISRIKIYKEKKELENSSSSKQEKTNINKIADFIKNNLLTIIVTALFLLILTIFLIIKIKIEKKRRRLE